MRSIALFAATLAAVSALSTEALAGKIFGDIVVGGKPVPAKVKVRVTRPGTSATADTTETDKFGSYKLQVKEEGKATLIVVWDGKPVELPVFSNKEATRYDLVLEKKEGKLILRRK